MKTNKETTPYKKEESAENNLFRRHYEILRMLLQRNGMALRLLADLEADLNFSPSSDPQLVPFVEQLQDETLLMAQELNIISNNHYRGLYSVLDRIRMTIKEHFSQISSDTSSELVFNLEDQHAVDADCVGGKAAGLALLRNLYPASIQPGFVLTPHAYRLFLSENRLSERIRDLVKNLDVAADKHRFSSITESIREMILTSTVPILIKDILKTHATHIEQQSEKSAIEAGWAVRSSAIGENGHLSFAGQFDTLLRIQSSKLSDAYREVIASRFSDRAVLYRLHNNSSEVDTPMAVLFMPMIEPAFSGVIQSADPRDGSRQKMVINTVPGSAEKLVEGTITADTISISGEEEFQCMTDSEDKTLPDYINIQILNNLVEMVSNIRNYLGHDVEIEWAVDNSQRITLLQCRRLRLPEINISDADTVKRTLPLIEGGITIFPGQAEGKVCFIQSGESPQIEPGSILIVNQPTPDMSIYLPQVSAFMAAFGNPTDHMATLAREFSIPCLYHLDDAIERLTPGMTISIDATRRKIYEGSIWPDVRRRGRKRLEERSSASRSGPLFDLVLALNLTQPFSPAFKPANIVSIHDGIRYIHEMAVRSMFRFADSQDSIWKKRTMKLDTSLPLNIKLLDLENRISDGIEKKVRPEQLASQPFQAFWQGLNDSALSWPERWNKVMAGISRDYQNQILGGTSGPRRRRDPNYCIIAQDYLNFNARFAYHYAMVDTIVGIHDHLNYVHFRFHNGGASLEQRMRRVKFIETILRENGFIVDCREDLLIAWFRQYPQPQSEKALTTLGRLLVCARQLDLLLVHDNETKRYVNYFLEGRYERFR